MRESIRTYRNMRRCKRRVLSHAPECWTVASERMYQYAKSQVISEAALWFVVTCGVAALVYVFS